MLTSKKLSSKINYDALNDLFVKHGGGQLAITGAGEEPAPRVTPAPAAGGNAARPAARPGGILIRGPLDAVRLFAVAEKQQLEGHVMMAVSVKSDKANTGFRFPCDGPGRVGTCQVSAWDHVFLGLFCTHKISSGSQSCMWSWSQHPPSCWHATAGR